MTQYRGNDLAEHFGIALKQVQAGLALLLRHSAGDHDDSRSSQVRVIPSADRQGMSERDGVINVVGFRFRSPAV